MPSTGQGRTPIGHVRSREWLEGYVLILPAAALLSLFTLWPAFQAIVLSFLGEDPFGRGRFWVGLANYAELFRDPAFFRTVLITFKFALIVAVVEVALSLLAAVLLQYSVPGIAIFRTIFFLTTAVSTAVAAVAWGWFLHPVGGVLNHILQWLHLSPQGWLTTPEWALYSVAAATAWQAIGFSTILLTAGLQDIPEDIYEAARIDGATGWTVFWRITLPLLSPVLFFVSVLALVRGFTAFGQIHLLTRGGPSEATTVWIYRIYLDAFFNFRFTYAAAEAALLFALLIVLTVIQFRSLERRVHYG
ncbi:MAG: sugar ABC transporter permease [Thermus antranikianii]|nr:MAG: sugar ABC transporter permease [Thermus antranikianii]